ncbi:aminotransferase class V-fold PLP-dependent enzyme [Portibacter lacus]|uniref:Selenocysteine lyase n=1 Tax=Portibacter lacus TaxID=1099794 RepID=A0AA37SP06_9BACT|nr:aminotransferase class V-fold PLP-dependent enzyme [Portibacter lacus]GLR17290.1 selenocysteine lyase [Portibacter lacus]
MSLEAHFKPFRNNICGIDQKIVTPQGEKPLVYADWIASGRFYNEIEEKIAKLITPIVANTHTETSYTGTVMTKAYSESKIIIKKHVNASSKDVLLFAGSGMTGAINKLQRIMGFKVYERTSNYLKSKKLQYHNDSKPVVFITHMEHHSNHTCWLETIVDLEIIKADPTGLVDLEHFAQLLEKHKDRKWKIASVTAGSNVTGIVPPFHKIAEMIHDVRGYCFVDFACSAPYVKIDMHPENPNQRLDAVFFSPHKFLGGPGTPGIVVFNSALYTNRVPDNPGGGTVVYTSPWTNHDYIEDIETREDGGTPPFIQGIRAAMCIQLKERMDPEKIQAREHELLAKVYQTFDEIEQISILADAHRERLGVVSFLHKEIHYNLFVKLLNDYFGVQVRGGCACAGTYGHYLLEIDQEISLSLRDKILRGENIDKPGWIRLSIHPTLSDDEIDYILEAIKAVSKNGKKWAKDYTYQPVKNEFLYIGDNECGHEAEVVNELFYEHISIPKQL